MVTIQIYLTDDDFAEVLVRARRSSLSAGQFIGRYIHDGLQHVTQKRLRVGSGSAAKKPPAA